MSERCPACEWSSYGARVVTLRAAVSGTPVYAFVCPRCGTVYASEEATEHMEADDE